jgi:hypothetical protein
MENGGIQYFYIGMLASCILYQKADNFEYYGAAKKLG